MTAFTHDHVEILPGDCIFVITHRHKLNRAGKIYTSKELAVCYAQVDSITFKNDFFTKNGWIGEAYTEEDIGDNAIRLIKVPVGKDNTFESEDEAKKALPEFMEHGLIDNVYGCPPTRGDTFDELLAAVNI